ncbi:MAG: pyridoxal phosphate-dependent aminotransferase [Bacteroidetes bacterium]|nr:MAG: pyridoxal phosphate-dependent aminotransferase [Bacteroidota bacterium]RLD81959.1 MAG: pyridoxal phosphate-dependent aminotransferase [Bacteroidota bacterium]
MIKKDTPINFDIVQDKIKESGLEVVGHGTIREIVRIVNKVEAETGQKFIRMEMGVPGLAPPEIGTNAEIAALKKGVASKYPMIEGVTELKTEISRFIKLFLDIDVKEEGCMPTVGSMQGSMAAFLVANRTDHTKKGTLFIDPGFPVQKQQCHVLGHDYETFDVYDYRGEKLKNKLESFLKKGTVSSILYSNPNNPAWICFTDEELKIIGELANKYDVIVIEDLAYFGMDFRKDYSRPGEEPFQPTVAKYTDNYIFLISSSKAFSYAGQRVGSMAISNHLFNRHYPELKRYYSSDGFGYSMIYGALYALSSGVTHSAQYGLAAMLKSANDGEFDFIDSVKIYGSRAVIMKKLFIDNGFNIVYDKDMDVPIADGFYFTFSYPGMSGVELLENLLYYGISAIALDITGSKRSEGLRACVSQTSEDQFGDLEYRLKSFNQDFGK